MTKILRQFIIAISLFSFLTSLNAQHVESADSILKKAFGEAAKENKNVFVIFHASWCGWCHKMDSSMTDKVCKQFFEDNYIILHLTVLESANKKQLENPGAIALLTKYKGDDQGIPFWLIFDKEGSLIADSQIRDEGEGLDKRGQNSGCPATAKEVEFFLNVLRKTSRITEPQLQVIEKRFRENES